MLEAAKKKVLSYTELILGVPEETYTSFAAGIETAMDEYLTHNFVVYLCRLLDGTEMASIKDREKFKYDTRLIPIGHGRSHGKQIGVEEYEEIVVGTSAMSICDWKRAHSLSSFALALFNHRLAFYVLNYCKKEHSINIREFFDFLILETKNSKKYSILNKAHSLIENSQENILKGKSPLTTFEFTEDLVFEANEAACIICLASLDEFYTELWEIVDQFLGTKKIHVEKDLLEEVFKYQRSLIPTWIRELNYTVVFKYNIPLYFQVLCIDKTKPVPKIKKRKSTIKIQDELGFNNNAVEFFKERLTITSLRIAAVDSIVYGIQTPVPQAETVVLGGAVCSAKSLVQNVV